MTLMERARELEAIRPAWQTLFERSAGATPFQSPAWLLPWWRHFGEGKLLALAAWKGSVLVGLLPTYVYRHGSRRKLILMGIGTSDYCDGLFDLSGGRDLPGRLLAELARFRDRFDMVDLQPLAMSSPLRCAPAPSGFSETHAVPETCPVLCLPDRAGALEEVLPRRMQQNLRYYRRRAARAGQLRVACATGRDLPELLGAFFRLHGARWVARGSPGVMGDERVRAFHTDAAPGLLRAGLLRLYALWLDERIAAVLYGLAGKGRFYYFLGGFDPELAEFSPGTLMIGHAIEQAAQEGLREFDFLRGAEPYKYLWGAKDRPVYARRLVPSRKDALSPSCAGER